MSMFPEKEVIYRYKYLPFDEGSLKSITEGTVKFTCPLDLNDPFDCRPYYDPQSILDIGKNRPDYIKMAAKLKGMKFSERVHKKNQMVMAMKNSFESGEFEKRLLSGVGAFCLSRDPLNILMWSHYAKFHQGFVLEFRIPTVGSEADLYKSDELLVPQKIKYRMNRPLIKVGLESDESMLYKLLFTKSNHWKYEKEERVINRGTGPGIHPYCRDEVLSSVIAGVKISSINFEALKDAVLMVEKNALPSLKVYKASEFEDKYKLSVPGHPRLNN